MEILAQKKLIEIISTLFEIQEDDSKKINRILKQRNVYIIFFC